MKTLYKTTLLLTTSKQALRPAHSNLKAIITSKRLNLLAIIGFLMFISCRACYAGQTDTPSVIAGNAKITGRIHYPDRTNDDSIMVTVVVPLPISGESGQYRALVDRSGRFVIDVDIETTFTIAVLHTSLNPQRISPDSSTTTYQQAAKGIDFLSTYGV